MKKIFLVIGFLILCSAFAAAQNTLPGDVKSGYLEIGKAKFYYEEKGTGMPMFMVHGGYIDRRMWDEQFNYFSNNYRVIRYDARNHGFTTSDSESFSNYEDLNNIMEKLNIDKAVVMGLSMGGLISIDFALEHPEKVIAIIPVSTGLSGFNAKDKAWQEFDKNLNDAYDKDGVNGAVECMLRAWTDGPLRKPEQVNKSVREKVGMMLKYTLDKIDFRLVPGRLSPPALDRLSEIKVPVLTIYGDIDMQGIIDISEKIEKEVAGSKRAVIKGAAHMVNMEYPDEFNKTVESFLKEISEK
ncbi:MAG: alpha/beta hydrolase [Ignavibacteria bacterium]|nr:alpha/beta hydrolase [Ignavibacteria bacterium]